jgi:hypothetical protein
LWCLHGWQMKCLNAKIYFFFDPKTIGRNVHNSSCDKLQESTIHADRWILILIRTPMQNYFKYHLWYNIFATWLYVIDLLCKWLMMLTRNDILKLLNYLIIFLSMGLKMSILWFHRLYFGIKFSSKDIYVQKMFAETILYKFGM